MQTILRAIWQLKQTSQCRFGAYTSYLWVSLVSDMTLKNLPAMWETWDWTLNWEDPLERGMTIHSYILAWRIPWTEEPGRLHYSPWGCKESDMTKQLTQRYSNRHLEKKLLEQQTSWDIYTVILMNFWMLNVDELWEWETSRATVLGDPTTLLWIFLKELYQLLTVRT